MLIRKLPFRDDPTWQTRVREIRAAGRRGDSAADIAVASGFSAASVQKLLAPGAHPRLSDPGDLLRTGRVRTGQIPADVQLYWFGFLTAAGYIRGQGPSLTLVVTLGEEGCGSLDALEADLMIGPRRCELCHSTLAGWQGYFRDPILCGALIPWGIPSDLYGEDAALLEELPDELFLPFIRGYTEGGAVARRRPSPGDASGITIRGTAAVLGSLNALIQRYWGLAPGRITRVGNDTVLHFAEDAARDAFETRVGDLQGRADLRGH